jgi:hypothetical protein
MGRRAARLGLGTLAALLLTLAIGVAPALACGGLVGPGGTVKLARTTTLAAWHGGMEHYLTSFEYAGGGAKFGSIVPLPGIPTKVEKGGEWTLQRLVRETQPQPVQFGAADAAGRSKAEELLKVRIDALDITILRGGGESVGTWAREHGFGLSVDAPEVLDFYAERSPIFMAASFDATAAKARGQALGDGTPVHLTIPTANPWIPLRILGLGLGPDEGIQADVYLLTDRKPALLPVATPKSGVNLERSEPASDALLADLRADKGMGWLPASGMWLSYLRLDTTAGRLQHDLAIDASGRGRPSRVEAGLTLAASTQQSQAGGRAIWPWSLIALGAVIALAAGVLLVGHRR